MTTRFDVPRAIEIKQLSNSELHRIFQKHKVTITAQEMDALIQAVDGHTLTIDLMARTLNSRWKKVTADMLLKALLERNLPDQDFRKITTDYNRSKKQERIYEHLRTVFNVAGVPDAAKSVLCYATLLPQDGMDAETFGMALQEDEQQTLDDLIDHGWLTVKDDILTIHPVVRLVCREELKPSNAKCRAFLDALGKSYNEDQYDASKMNQMAELYSIASEDLDEYYETWSNRAGFLWDKLGNIQKALVFYERVLHRLISIPNADSDSIATAYCNASIAHGTLGNYDKALEYALNSLDLRRMNLDSKDPNLAVSHNAVGLAYADLGNISDALKHMLLALSIWECANPRDDHSCAICYSNIGHIYGEQDDHGNALKYKLKSLDLWKLILKNKDHPNLALIYNNIAMTHNVMGSYSEALDCMMESLRICKQTLPPSHHYFSTCYGNIAETLMYLDRYTEAKEYIFKAIDSAKVSYPKDHPLVQRYLHFSEMIESLEKQHAVYLDSLAP